ncbi:MAG: phosphoribosylformylglycinamidine cyclo-ligase [Bacteriovoracaceae bacterium]
MAIDYKSSGVDIDLADKFVDRIKRMVGKTYDDRTIAAVGGFAALYRMDENRLLAASTDGVGTKLKLAIETGIHHTIGIDLVAMCVNDLICTGARPLFFLDYFASGKLNLEVSEKVLEGIVEGCLQSKMALIGGETAEMPGIYQNGDYDLAGFSVGEVSTEKLIDGSRVRVGDSLIGISSSGFHSNGFSLIRKVIEQVPQEVERQRLKKSCLVPTKIYVETFKHLEEKLGASLTGLAHITGSGLLNVPRINEKFDYDLSFLPSANELPSFMVEIMERTGLKKENLCHTFNMGIGLVIATSRPEEALELLKLKNEKAWVIGTVQVGTGEVRLPR